MQIGVGGMLLEFEIIDPDLLGCGLYLFSFMKFITLDEGYPNQNWFRLRFSFICSGFAPRKRVCRLDLEIVFHR